MMRLTPALTHSRIVLMLCLLTYALSLIGLFLGFGFTVADPSAATKLTFSALVLYVFSYVLVVLAAASVYQAFRLSASRGVRVFYFLTTLAIAFITLYLWNIGFIGLKLWNY